MQGSPLIAHSPSFSSYSSEKLADIAARVVREIANDPPYNDSDDLSSIFPWNDFQLEDNQNDTVREENDDDFEFAVVWREADSSPISADEIFYNGQIRPIYPLFNTDLLSKEERELSIANLTVSKQTTTTTTTTRSPLKKLLGEDRGGEGVMTSSSCSSSEADELDGVSPSTYCAWAPPRKAAEDKERCKKSRSAGSSKRWKLRDLVFRSNSDGKETFVFLAPPPAGKKSVRLLGDYREIENNNKNKKEQEVKGSVTVRGVEDGNKRPSFLPHGHEFVGLFSNNVNGLNKNLHPF